MNFWKSTWSGRSGRSAAAFALTALVAFVGLAALLVGCGPKTSSNNGTQDDASWQQAFEASESGWLLSVAGSSASNLYAVGGEPDRGRIWHFDGASWAEQEVPEGVPLLNWVHVFDDGTPVVAGNDGTILRLRDGAWAREATTTDQDLWGVWGEDATQIWAVGGNGRAGDEATLLFYEAEGPWEARAIPSLERPNVRALFKVWGSSADDVYIVGQRGVVLHWDGSALEELLVGTSEDLISVWGTGPDNVVIVGGRSNGVVAHFDGGDWTTRSLAPTPGINGVWLQDPETAWIAGNSGTLGRVDLGGGDADVFVLETDDVETGLDLHAVFGVDQERFAVGGNFGMPQGPYEGIAVTRQAVTRQALTRQAVTRQAVTRQAVRRKAVIREATP